MRKIMVLACAALLVAAVGCGKGGDGKGNNGDGVKGAANVSKAQFLEYLAKKLAMYETAEYGELLAKYKAETKGMQDIGDRQKVWEKYLKGYQDKELALMKAYGMSLMDVMDLTTRFNKDQDVMKEVWKLSKYVAF